MSKPTDTSKIDPAVHLAEAMAFGSSDAITMSESAGQAELVNSSAIPTDRRCTDDELIALGFKLGQVDASDPMFQDCELPKGWAREGSDHAMWSYICDDRGFRRISIFYKAAFYDRSAHMSIDRDPETRAQAETYEAFADAYNGEQWSSFHSRKDGDNLVRIAREMVLDEGGHKVFDRAAGKFAETGRVVERVIAPDGSTVGEQEFPEQS